MKKILLTGGAGFIGSNFLHSIAIKPEIANKFEFIVVDSLTYAGDYNRIENLIKNNLNIKFYKTDIRDFKKISELFEIIQPDGVIHYAAESHVDNSIHNPLVFVETNVLGTAVLLNAALKVFKLNPAFRFVHVSTDEVYGSLKELDPAFTELHPLSPNSPYSASKASSDLLCRSFFETFKLPVMITRCSNNYGPRQHNEKLIPLMISNAKSGKLLPVYGNGKNIRDWIHVDDHNEGIWRVFQNGQPGEVYNFGGNCELRNIDIVKMIISFSSANDQQISFVADRLGHDWRYAMNSEKAQRELNWRPQKIFKEELKKLIEQY